MLKVLSVALLDSNYWREFLVHYASKTLWAIRFHSSVDLPLRPVPLPIHSRSFRSRLIGQHLADKSHDLATLTFDLGRLYGRYIISSMDDVFLQTVY